MIGSVRKRVQKKLDYMGLKVKNEIFIIMRLISSLILFIFLFFFIDYGYIVAPICTVIYYIFVEYVILDLGIKRRIDVLEDDSLELMPVFLMCLRSGRNVKNAINLSVSIIDNDLSQEFKKVLKSIELGKSLDEALKELKNRMPSEIIINIIISIMEANRLGNSVNDSINIQLGYIKERKRKSILTRYKTIPFKLALISIVFVLIILIFLMMFNMYA